MKYAVYILTALLAVIVIVFILLNMIEYIDSAYDAFNSPSFWYPFLINIYDIAVLVTYGVLSLIQLKKSTPRLILIFSGYIFFNNIGFAFQFRSWFLLCIIAGLLSAAYEFIKHGRQVKKAPCQYERYRGLLIAAGVLAFINVAYGVLRIIPDYNIIFHGILLIFCYSIVVGFITSICICIFCFIRHRRTSILYRMFFIGPYVIGAVFIPSNIVYNLVLSESSDNFTTSDPIGIIISLMLTILILIHTLKTRHDSILPQGAAGPPQQEEMPAV